MELQVGKEIFRKTLEDRAGTEIECLRIAGKGDIIICDSNEVPPDDCYLILMVGSSKLENQGIYIPALPTGDTVRVTRVEISTTINFI